MRALPLLCLLLAVWLRGAAPDATDRLFQAARPAMGTTVELRLYAPDAAHAQAWFDLAFEEIERVEAALSTYRPTSELSRLNAHAAAAPVTTDPEVFALLEEALAFSRATGGAFDITVGRLVETWGFFRGAGRYPSDAALADAQAQTGWRHVRLDPSARTVAFERSGLKLDLGGMGKGYALDRVATLLRAHGVRAALLGIGQSSYVALGAPPEKAGWPIHVPHPFVRTDTLSTILLRNAALSTSGNYEKFFELEGRIYGHILDPRTGHPVEDRVQVTVVAPRAADADALSTALFVLGATDLGRHVLDTHDAAALWVEGPPEAPRLHTHAWPYPVPLLTSLQIDP